MREEKFTEEGKMGMTRWNEGKKKRKRRQGAKMMEEEGKRKNGR